jgi:hypothetical protein
MSVCAFCGDSLMPKKMYCQRCGLWTQSETGAIGGVSKAKTTTLDQVVGTQVQRICVGEPWDECFGGGIVVTSSSLIGGAPGGGKTTGLLQISSKMAEITGKRAYLISAEQAPGDIKLTVDRLKLDASRFRVLSEYGGGGGADVDEDLLKEDPPAAFVIDSVSAMCGKDVHAAIMIARKYKMLANKCQAAAFLICHMTKESDFAGLLALQHEVDTLVTIFPEDNGQRALKPWKNRFGPTHAEYFMMMTELGLVQIPKKDKGKKSSVSVPSELDARRGPGDEEDFEDEEEDADEEEDEGDGGGGDGIEAAKPKARVPRFQAAVEASAALSPPAAVSPSVKARPVVLPRPPPLPPPVVGPPTAAERAARIRAKLAAKKAKKKMTSVSVEVTYLACVARR